MSTLLWICLERYAVAVVLGLLMLAISYVGKCLIADNDRPEPPDASDMDNDTETRPLV